MAIIRENAPRRPQSGDFQWSDVYVVCLEYWRIILLSILFFVCCAGLYLYFAHPQYLVSGKMLIIDKSKKNSTMSAGMAMLSQIPFGLGSSIGGSLGVDNEKEILQSKVLLRDVVNDLGLYTEYRLSKWGRGKLLYQEQPVNAVIDQAHLNKLDADLPATYRQLELTIVKKSDGYHVEGELTVNDDEFEVPVKVFTTLPATYSTEIGPIVLSENKLLSPELKEKYAKDYKLKVTICPPMQMARQYAGTLNVDNDLKVASSVIELRLKDENILRGIDFVNRMVEVYNRRANEEKDEEARKNDEFVTARLAKIDAELGSSDANWEKFKKINQVTDPQLDATETITKKSEYESKLVEVGTQQQLLDYLSEYVNNPTNHNELIPSSIGITDEATIALITQYNEQVQELKRLLRGNKETSPRVQQLSSSVSELNASVRTALSQARQSSKIMRQNIEREYNKYLGRVSSAPQQERVLTEIGRVREIKQSVYLMMLQKREENAMDLANTADKGKLIDQTSYERKVQPRGGMLLVVALMVGFLLPVVLLLIWKKNRNRIETPEALSQLTSNPVLGWLPMECSQSEDAFRSFRSALLNQLGDNKKVILITSPQGQEGTTYVAARLADRLGRSGKKVGYCSMDFHGASSSADVGAAEKCAFVDLVPAALMEGRQPADLLNYDLLYRVMSTLRYRYDYVVIDCPAITRYPDALEVAKCADVTCCVCRAEQTPKPAVEQVCKLAEEYKLPNLSFVLNAVDMKKSKYRHFFSFSHFLILSLFLVSCGSSKNVAYFQNSDTINLDASQVQYEARIMPKDILTITVSTINPEAASSFNLTVPTAMTQSLSATTTSQPALQSYLVGNDGNIQYPIIGTIHVGGLTTKETEQLILKQILPYMSDTENPIVTVRLSSYSISVMGEVQNPGCYQVSREKVSVLEALAMAGDLTIYGVRNNVRLIREDASGKKSIYKLDLNDANLLNSPYYYLQQNDILYVEPNKAKAQNSDIGSMTTLWFSATSILISLTSLLYNILR